MHATFTANEELVTVVPKLKCAAKLLWKTIELTPPVPVEVRCNARGVPTCALTHHALSRYPCGSLVTSRSATSASSGYLRGWKERVWRAHSTKSDNRSINTRARHSRHLLTDRPGLNLQTEELTHLPFHYVEVAKELLNMCVQYVSPPAYRLAPI